MKKNILLFFLIGIISTGMAQYEAAHWFFGYHAGLDFTTGAPAPETGAQINTEEGCSSISNACGDLLLYTDGVTVWNANHQIMLNGSHLNGNASSTQSGIVVPKPDDNYTYYVFTVDEAFSAPSNLGLQYSVVDMHLDGGLGGIVSGQKNLRLVQTASEKVTAVMSADGSSVWVITLAPPTTATTAPYPTTGSNMNTFYAFKIDHTGVQMTATVSTLALNISYGIGYMKASPDGTKLAVANAKDNTAYLLDFDDATGVISNPVSLRLDQGNNSPYGLEFSPDSSKLYLSDWHDKVTQFDLADNNLETIINTRSNYRSALQLGLDGKIYQTYTVGYGSGSQFLSVIEHPNVAGTACSYRYKYVHLPNGMEAHQGLPPFIQSYFVQVAAPDVTAEFTNRLEVESNEEIASVDWDFGDGNTTTSFPDNPPDNTHSQTQHAYTTPGTYTITAILHLVMGCDVSVTKIVIIPPIIDQNLTSFCTDNVSGIDTMNLHDFDDDIIASQGTSSSYQIKYYLSEADALNDQNEIVGNYTNTTHSDKLYYAMTNISSGATSYGTFYLHINPNPVIAPVSDYEICDTDSDGIATFDLSRKTTEILGANSNLPYDVTFYNSASDAEAGSNSLTDPTAYTNVNPNNETIWYRITKTDTGCHNEGSFNLIVHPLILINMDETYKFCMGSSIQIDAPAGFVSYLWSTGETTRDISVNSPGQISLTVTDANGCSNSKNITVEASDKAVIDDIKIEDFSLSNNKITIYASGIGAYEYSLDGINYQDSSIFDHLSPGTYTVYVADKNACGVVTQTVDLLGSPQFFTPNGDGQNDLWQIVNIQKRPETIVRIFNRYGKLVKTMTSSDAGWDGTMQGKPLPADDYWFVVTIKEPDGRSRLRKGHFALKR